MPERPDLTREPEGKRAELKPITKATPHRESAVARTKQSIFAGSATTVGKYVLETVLLPTLKDTIAQMVTGAIETALYGEPRSGKRSPSSSYYTNYRSYSDRRDSGPTRNSAALREREDRRAERSGYRPLCVEKREDAEDVISSLCEVADRYDYATLGDYYSLVGMSQTYTDEDWGWTIDDITDVEPSRVRDGWLIDLPTPSYLKEGHRK